MAKGKATKGFNSLIKKLQTISDNYTENLARALTEEAENIMTESKELVPVDTGTLRSSGFVGQPEIGKTKVSVTLGYGGPSAAYAVYVHENLNAYHPVGQALYLKVPLDKAKKGFGTRIAKKLKSKT